MGRFYQSCMSASPSTAAINDGAQSEQLNSAPIHPFDPNRSSSSLGVSVLLTQLRYLLAEQIGVRFDLNIELKLNVCHRSVAMDGPI
jgi:hypothetical protein